MRINYTQVIRQAGKIEDLGGEVKNLKNLINKSMSECVGTWQGKTAGTYTNSSGELQSTTIMCGSKMASVARKIKAIAKRIHDEDEAQARRMRNRD